MTSSTLVQLRRTLATFCGLLVLLAAAQVLAAKPRVGVPVFQGKGEGPVRAKVIKALKTNGYQVVGAKQLKATASSSGANLDTNDGFATVAKELGISAFVTGELAKKKATITVRNGSDGFVLGEASFAGASPGKMKAAVAAGFWRRLGSAVAKGSPPSGAKAKAPVAEEAEPADSDDGKEDSGLAGSSSESKESESRETSSAKKDEDEGEEKKPEPRRRPPARKAAAEEEPSGPSGGLKALELGVGAKAFWRKFTPHDDPNKSLSSYSISPGGAGTVWLETFPAAFSSTGFAANIGLVAGLDKGLAISSKTQDGLTKFTTNYLAWNVGLKVRFPVGTAVPFVGVGYGKQSYKLVPQGGAARPAGILDVDYSSIAISAGSSFLLGPSFALDLGAAYFLVTSPGADITSAAHFKNAKAQAIDLGASAVFYVTPLIGIRAGLDFRQYGLDFKVTSDSAPLIVGGATDRYISLWGGLEIAFDAVGGSSEEAPPKPTPKRAPPKPAASEEE